MKKVLFLVFTLIVSLFLPLKALAAENGLEKVRILPKGTTVNRDYFSAAESVQLMGNVGSDAYVAGGNVMVAGIINGDLLVAGGNIDISGKILGDVRVIGGKINMTGEVGKNVTVVGGSAYISESARIGGSIVAAGGDVNIYGTVNKNVVIAAGKAIIGSSVLGSVETYAEDLNIVSPAKIRGDFTYWSNKEALIDQEVIITGEVVKNIVDTPQMNREKTRFEASRMAGQFGSAVNIFSLLSILLIGLIGIKLFPNFFVFTSETINTRAWASLGLGLTVLIVAPIAFVILLITIIAAPLGFIGVAILSVHTYLAKLFVIYWAGGKVLKNGSSPTKTFLTGLLIYALISFVPVVNIFVKLTVLMIGLGAALLTIRSSYKKASATKII